MSPAYNSRRAPHVSQYLANLNTVPTQHELAAQNELSLGDDDLDFLTNAEFFDFDQFGGGAGSNVAYDGQHHPQQPQQYRNGMPYPFPAVQQPGLQQPPAPQQGQPQQPQQNLASTPSSMESQSPIQTLQGVYPNQPHHFVHTNDKRSGSLSMPSVGDMEEASRMAAEEDKRRRNTAASARFRVKKKQREQALEKQAKDMSDKVAQLEGKVQQLEMENKWLKELITEKSDAKSLDTMDVTHSKKSDDRIVENHTDGVGTKQELDL